MHDRHHADGAITGCLDVLFHALIRQHALPMGGRRCLALRIQRRGIVAALARSERLHLARHRVALPADADYRIDRDVAGETLVEVVTLEV